MSAPLVSVLLLTRNGAATLPRVLAAIRSQVVPFPFELVAVDSGSEDGTVELLQSQADRLIEIRAEDFNHGTTRNVGVEACRAPLVVLLVQDAEPAAADWLATLVEPLLAGDSAGGGPLHPLAGTYARQVPRPDASPVVRAYLSQYPATGSTPRRQSIASPAEFDALTPGGRLAACTFDNVCSCIRREVWERHPFRAAPIAEDLAWAREVMLAGHDLAYVPDAVVLHSHDRSAGYELRRTYLVHQQLRRLFGLATIPGRVHLARSIVLSVLAHTRWTLGGPGAVGVKVKQLPRALALAVRHAPGPVPSGPGRRMTDVNCSGCGACDAHSVCRARLPSGSHWRNGALRLRVSPRPSGAAATTSSYWRAKPARMSPSTASVAIAPAKLASSASTTPFATRRRSNIPIATRGSTRLRARCSTRCGRTWSTPIT